MDVEPAFVSDGKPAEAVEPGEAPLDDPSVPAEFLLRFDPAPGDARLDATPMTGASTATVITGFVGMQLVGPASWSAAFACDGRHGVEQVLERHAVVDVGSGQPDASGMPRRSVIRWRFVSGLPRSVGFGPVAAPPFWRRRTSRLCRRGCSRCGQHGVDAAAVRGAGFSIRRLLANHATCASTSPLIRSPSQLAASPTGRRCAAQTQCLSARHAPAQEVGHLSVWLQRAAAAVR